MRGRGGEEGGEGGEEGGEGGEEGERRGRGGGEREERREEKGGEEGETGEWDNNCSCIGMHCGYTQCALPTEKWLRRGNSGTLCGWVRIQKSWSLEERGELG